MTDEPRDDEIIGRALSRAIETQYIRETPYDESRIGAPRGRSFAWIWQLAGAAVVLIVGAGMASWLLRPSPAQPVAASPVPSIAASVIPSTGPAVSGTPTPAATVATLPGGDHERVFLWGAPPTSVHVAGVGTQGAIDERIKSRVEALNNAVSGLSGTILLADPKQLFVRKVAVQGDLATIDYSADPPTGLAMEQEIVYTATEEPGIARVLVTVNGSPMKRQQGVWDKALTRDDVSGYTLTGSTTDPIEYKGIDGSGFIATATYSVDTMARGLARVVVTITRPQGGAVADVPSFALNMARSEDKTLGGKTTLTLQLAASPDKVRTDLIDRSPLRGIRVAPGFGSPITTGGVAFVLGLDDARPWRVFTMSNPVRIVIDIGGVPAETSDRIAVYSPAPIAHVTGATLASQPSVGQQFTVSGTARVFEANVVWRVKDSTQRVIASGRTTASLGTSMLWGTFSTDVVLPASVTGNVTLEVYEASPRDGSEQGVVAIPLVVR